MTPSQTFYVFSLLSTKYQQYLGIKGLLDPRKTGLEKDWVASGGEMEANESERWN